MAAAQLGDLPKARVGMEEAVRLALNLAQLAFLERRHADAVEPAQEAVALAIAIGDRHAAAAAAVTLAWSLAERRQPERAARLLGAAREFYRQTGTAMQWSEAACEHAVRDALDAQLDEPRCNELLEAGHAMTVEQAIRSDRQKSEQPA